jgi:hypothetical protein
MSARTGDLPLHQANWMSAHATQLAETIPLPRYRWRWSEVAVSTGALRKLRDFGLIERSYNDRWQTRRECIHAISDYGGCPVEEVGVAVGQVPLWGVQ